MPANPFDQFDAPAEGANPFDQFDGAAVATEENPFDQFEAPPEAELRAAEPPSLLTRAREALSPLMGETANQTFIREQQSARFAQDFPGLAGMIAQNPNAAKQVELTRRGLPGVVETLSTAAEGTPQIPAIPQQEGTLAQVAAGVGNLGVGLVNSLPSPLGALGAMGGGASLAALAGSAPLLAEMGTGAVRTLASDEASVQDKVTAGAGLGLLAVGGAVGAREIGRLRAPAAPLPDVTNPSARTAPRPPRSGPVVDAEYVGETLALPESALPAPDLLRLGGGRRLALTNGDTPPPAPPTLLALPEGVALPDTVPAGSVPAIVPETPAPAAPAPIAAPAPVPFLPAAALPPIAPEIPAPAALRPPPAPLAVAEPAAPLNAAAEKVGAKTAPEPSGVAEPAGPPAEVKPAANPFAEIVATQSKRALRERSKQLNEVLTRPGISPKRQATATTELRAIQDELGTRLAAGSTGRGFRLSPLPDGTLDLLNDIEEEGGIRGPREGEAGGEYDGYAETFNSGLPRLLRNANGVPVDKLMGFLEDRGYRFDTPDDFYSAVSQAVVNRTRARQRFEQQMQGDKFVQAALENRGRARGEAAGKPQPVDSLQVGDTFKVKRESFEVVDIDPETFDVIVKDGPRFGTQVLPAGQTLYPDKRSLRRVPRAEADQWPDMTPAEVAAPATATGTAEQAAPAAPLATVPRPGGGLFDGGETGGDTTFNLAGETTQDFTGNMDAQAAAAEARAAAARAQRGLFDAEPLGIARGADTFRKIQKIFAPETLLPEDFRRAVRLGQQAERSILIEGQAIQKDLASTMNAARKTVPNIDDDVRLVLTGQAASGTLPQSVRGPVIRARALLDGLTDRAIREGVVQGDLAVTFASNRGQYLRRAYRIFEDDAAWFADPEFYAKARPQWLAYLQNQVNPATGRLHTRAEAELFTARLLDRGDASNFLLGGKIAGRDVSGLMRRKDLVPELRALYGEITDPVQMFGQTVPRLAGLIENHGAQQWIRLIGLRNGLFSTTPDALRHVQLVADTNRPHEVWRGLYTTRELADAMQREAKADRAGGATGALLGALRTATTASKLAKTVFNPDSWAPNLIGGLVSALANGNVNLLPGGRGLLLGAEEIGLLRTAGVLPTTRQALQTEIAKLTRYGLRGEGVSAADLVQTWERSLVPVARGQVNRLLMPILNAYGAVDDLTKYIAWKSEVARVQRWNPGLSVEAAERFAAERVRATMPTYSEIPKFIKELSQLGISPPFVNFTWEMFRNTYNSARIGYTDMAEGVRTGNSARAIDGARRTASLMAVLGVSTAVVGGVSLAVLSRREHGISDEQDEAVRFFGAPWNREAQLVYLSKLKDGRLQFANSSYLLPHALLTQAVEAAQRGKTDEEAARAFLNTFWEQFVSADGGLVLGASAEMLTGYDRETGRRVLNPQSPTPAADALAYLYDKSFDPGLRKKIERGLLAVRGEKGPYGQVYSLREEALRLAGARAMTLDFNQAVQFKARDLARDFGDASNIYSSMRGRNVSPADLEAAYQKAEVSRRKVFGQVQDYLRLSRAAGVTEDNAVRALRKAAGLGPAVILGALDGRYVPQEREKPESLSDAVTRVGDLPAAEQQREIVRLTLENPAFLRAMVEAKKKKILGVTQRDELVAGLGVQDGARAAYVRSQMLALPTPSARQDYLLNLARKGIVTEQVFAQMME